jgi:hypothetical protein
MQLPTNLNIQHLQLPLTDSNNLQLSNQIDKNIITNNMPTNNFNIADNINLKNNIPLPEFQIINEPGQNVIGSQTFEMNVNYKGEVHKTKQEVLPNLSDFEHNINNLKKLSSNELDACIISYLIISDRRSATTRKKNKAFIRGSIWFNK